MAKPFKQLLGNRIYITIPKQEETKLIVDENTKDALNKELLKKMSKLPVHSVGDIITNIKEGDVVLVHPEALAKALMIPLTDQEFVYLVSPFDIIHIW